MATLVFEVLLPLVKELPLGTVSLLDTALDSLPDVAVQSETGRAPRSSIWLDDGLDGPLCHPPRADQRHIVTGTPGSDLEPCHLRSPSAAQRISEELEDVGQVVRSDRSWLFAANG